MVAAAMCVVHSSAVRVCTTCVHTVLYPDSDYQSEATKEEAEYTRNCTDCCCVRRHHHLAYLSLCDCPPPPPPPPPLPPKVETSGLDPNPQDCSLGVAGPVHYTVYVCISCCSTWLREQTD